MKHGLHLLTKNDLPYLIDHYKRLSHEERYYRFGRSLSDHQIEYQIKNIAWETSTYGIYEWDLLVAVAHVIKSNPTSASAELGISVNSSHQGKKLGTRLLSECLEWAISKGITTLDVYYIADNRKMAAITSKLPGKLHRDGSELHKQVQIKEWWTNSGQELTKMYC